MALLDTLLKFSQGCNWSVSQAVFLSEGWGGKIHFQVHLIVDGSNFLAAVWVRPFFSYDLSARMPLSSYNCPRVFTLAPLDKPLATSQLTSSKPSAKQNLILRKVIMKVTSLHLSMWCNLIQAVTFYHFCIFYWLKAHSAYTQAQWMTWGYNLSGVALRCVLYTV